MVSGPLVSHLPSSRRGCHSPLGKAPVSSAKTSHMSVHVPVGANLNQRQTHLVRKLSVTHGLLLFFICVFSLWLFFYQVQPMGAQYLKKVIELDIICLGGLRSISSSIETQQFSCDFGSNILGC